ncbi:unc-93 homolog A, partial [Pelobates cultripes]
MSILCLTVCLGFLAGILELIWVGAEPCVPCGGSLDDLTQATYVVVHKFAVPDIRSQQRTVPRAGYLVRRERVYYGGEWGDRAREFIVVCWVGNRPNERSSLISPFEGCGVLAVIIVATFLDQIDISEEPKNEGDVKISVWKSLLATFNQLRDIRQCLLIPLTMFSGFQQGFLSSDYTKSYVTCSLGIHFVGYVMICFAATNAICSLLFGKLSQYTGRIFLFSMAAITNIACIIALLLWRPHPNQLAVFFIFPALWGMADAVWQTQTNALYGVLFDKHKEAAFANYRLWESLGFVIAYGYSTFLCVSVKLYILVSVLVLAMVLYGCVEYLENKKVPNLVERRTSVSQAIIGVSSNVQVGERLRTSSSDVY